MTIYHDYYVYAFLREDLTPYYIGKGRKNRAFSNQRSKFAKKPSDPQRIRIFLKNLSEEESYQWERYWINIFGRIDLGTGILHNLTAGGEGNTGLMRSEGTSKGKIISEETKQKMSRSQKNRIISKEHRRKLCEAKKGEKHPLYGKTHSEETKQKMRGSHKGKIISEETKQKMSESAKRKIISEETRKKMREGRKKYFAEKKM